MNRKDAGPHLCRHCGRKILKRYEFCPYCGILFRETVACSEHPSRPAVGACVICCHPLCAQSLRMVQGHYLCDLHRGLEIYEDMVRVFGNSDAAQVDFAKSSLESAGLHPMTFSRKASPLSMGGPEYTLFRASGEYDGHIINEFKLMVPCGEYQDAKKILEKLHLST